MPSSEPRPEDLDGLTLANKRMVQRLAATPSAKPLADLHRKAQAAVAVFLFQASVEAFAALDAAENGIPYASPAAESPPSTPPDADTPLHVLFTTRAPFLRSHPNQGSLPGGKMDPGDRGPEDTAARESEEEVGLPRRCQARREYIWLHTAEPFISKTSLLVHPVIYLIPPHSSAHVLSRLRANPSEVTALWSFPLLAFLRSTAPPTHHLAGRPLSDPSYLDTHRPPQHAFRTYSDVPWFTKHKGNGQAPYRLHRFRTTGPHIKGLTADMLIHVGQLATGQAARFDVVAPGQPDWAVLREIVKRRAKKGERESRWGDGESGDAQGSGLRYETVIGVDIVDGPMQEAPA